MIPIDLSGKVALVTGVSDDEGFAWQIAKTLNAAGARIVLACHPRVVSIVDAFLTREHDAESRKLPFDKGELKVEKLLACDVAFDSMNDVDEKTKNDRRYAKHGDYTIRGLFDILSKDYPTIDILIHSVAFSAEIKNRMADTSRAAYLNAISISAYSLTGLLKAAAPQMANKPGGTSAIALTYLGGERVVPHYGGGMSSAKAALQMDVKQLAQNYGKDGIRVNCLSPGPFASRAARSIGNIQDMINHAVERSPIPRPITAEDVANATLMMCSPLAAAITGQILYVDCGYNVMGV